MIEDAAHRMPPRPDTDDYRTLFLQGAPMMDMRAPVEFAQGAFPNATSLPLMSDDERRQVGICYKQKGQDAAIELGHTLVSGDVREQRLAAWLDFARSHPDGYLYCFRGGLRSATVQQWLRDAGVDYPLVRGGYKAMRRFLIKALSESLSGLQLTLIAGSTGTGKTRVIHALSRAVDLEGMAHHRGSAFGQLLEPQPSQIDFENTLSVALLRLLGGGDKRVFMEDEGRLIGRLSLPENLRDHMAGVPLLVVEEPLSSRVDAVVEDYIHDLGERFEAHYPGEGPEQHRQKMQADLARVRKRLGGLLYKQASAQMDAAFDLQWRSGDDTGHRVWIEMLLRDYYDPMYTYQIGKRHGEVLFRGRRSEVIQYAQDMAPSAG